MPEEIIEKPSIIEFLRTMCRITGAKMSGALSVPFTAAAVFCPTHGQPIWISLAVFSIVFAFYFAWAEERKKVISLADSLNPRISMTLLWPVNAAAGSRVALLHVTNGSGRIAENCQIDMEGSYLCPPFNLRPGEARHIPIIQGGLNDENQPYITIHTYRKEDDNWRESEVGWIPREGTYNIRLLSDHLFPVESRISISYNGDWIIESA